MKKVKIEYPPDVPGFLVVTFQDDDSKSSFLMDADSVHLVSSELHKAWLNLKYGPLGKPN